MSERDEQYERRRRKDSSSSLSSDSSSSSYSSASDDGDKKAKISSKHEKIAEPKNLKRIEEKRSLPDKRESSKSYDHRSKKSYDTERDRKRERTRSRSRSRDKKRERSHRRSKSPEYRHSSHRYSRKDHERDRRRSRSRSRSYRTMPRKDSYNRSLKKLNILEKLGIELKVPQNQSPVTQSAQLPAGVTIPSYYNLAGVNPLKYVEQMQKRKLLWGNSQKQAAQTSTENTEEKAETVGPETVWKGTSFSNDADGKVNAKFKRLMGIKSTEDDKGPVGSGSTLIKKQEEIFESMEKQYEVARVATHTHRGVGLGFGVHQPR